MCFSATASFTAAAGLSIISLLSIKQTHTKKMLALAASPLFFAIQQFCEGLVWQTLNNGDTTSLLHKIGMYGFLFFAALWWPIWIPLALSLAEKVSSRKNALFIIMIIGLCAAISLLFCWVLQTTGAEIINHHINYPVPNYPFNGSSTHFAQYIAGAISLCYCIATIIPFFISSIPYIWINGITIASGFVIAYVFYFTAFPSVWCFFAAISSIMIYFIIKNSHKS